MLRLTWKSYHANKYQSLVFYPKYSLLSENKNKKIGLFLIAECICRAAAIASLAR